MAQTRDGKQYLLLDSYSQPLARALLENSPQAEKLQLRVLEGQQDTVTCHEVIQLVSIDSEDRPMKCQLVQHRGERILLEPLEVLDPKVRHNLRIPVRFETLIYPVSGKWKGRRKIRSIDLSCGGIAFYAEAGLMENERLEVVIPITEQPLIVTCSILRVQQLQNGRTMYAAQFVDLCHDEETTIRRAVFGVQIRDSLARSGQ